MRKADNLPPYRAVVMKSGSLNFLEPSGPARPVMGELYFYYDVGRDSVVGIATRRSGLSWNRIPLGTTFSGHKTAGARR